MEKIKTGLPYKLDGDQIDSDIQKYGAVVDITDLHFPEIPGRTQQQTALIYLRNTNLDDIELDFSNCTLQEKFNWLYLYIESEITYPIKQLVDSWVYILVYAQGFKLPDVHCILDDQQVQQFIQQDNGSIAGILTFIQSTPLFILYRLAGDDQNSKLLDMSEFDVNDSKIPSKNIYFVLQHPEINLVISSSRALPIAFYTKEFTDQNEQLFECLKSLDFYNTIDTIGRADKESLQLIVDTIAQVSYGK